MDAFAMGDANQRLRWPHATLSILAPFTLAAFAVGLATGLDALLWPYSASTLFSVYYLAVAISARYGPFASGVWTILLTPVPVAYFFLPKVGGAPMGAANLAAMVTFALVSTVLAFLIFDLRRHREKTLRSERRLSSIVDAAISAVISIDSSHNIVSINRAGERMLRCPNAEAVGQPIETFIPERYHAKVKRLVSAEAVTELEPIMGLRADGQEFPVEASIAADGRKFVTFILRDISERLADEAELRRLNRLYSALSEINQGIVLSRDRTELFNRTCRSLVQAGGFRMAWVGWHDALGRRLIPIAEFGDRDGYLLGLTVTTDDMPTSRGPTGTAFREGRFRICEDMLSDPTLAPWQEAIRQAGFRGSAAFPLRLLGEVEGVLTVYAHEAGFFREKEIALLEEAASDISFALDGFSREHERQKANAIAQRESDFSNAMIESMPGIVYFYNEEGRFLRWNRNFETVSSYSRDEIATMHPLQFFPTDDKRPVEQRIKDVFASGDASVEASFVSKNGVATPYFFTGRRVDFDGMTCLVGVGIDISERKRAEEALRDLNESLERNVLDRTRQLQSALVRAEQADRTKSAFLATMSHELRTPLNSIIGFTGIVLKGLAGPLNAEQTKQLGMVRGSARHLLDLINDVLDISKIEAGELDVHPKPFDLREAVERVVASVAPLADNKGLSLEVRTFPSDCYLISDRRRVEQVLLNLMNNAIKFTSHGGVTLDIEKRGSQGDDAVEPTSIRFRVSDTGIGIRHEDFEKLFTPFRQLETGLSRQHEGTGLGLAICQRLAALLGGEITVESEWRRGSVFTFTLPFTKPH
jgi:PAS domain S-box-containing protein